MTRRILTTAALAMAILVAPLAMSAAIQLPGTVAAAKDIRVLRHDSSAARQINAYRAKFGLGPLSVDPKLSRIAAEHARDLALSGMTGHTGSDGSNPADRATRGGYRFRMIGENASAGRTELSDVIRAWIRSPSHQVNMVLDPASDFGLAHLIAPGTRYGHYWILMVGEKRPPRPSAEQGRTRSGASAGAGGSLKLRNGFTGGFSGPRRKP